MRREDKRVAKGLAATLAVFALLLAAALFLFRGIDRVSEEEQTALVRDAVRGALVTCYAVEGSYPTDVAYLKEHYGLDYDAQRYMVSIDAFASNVMPVVRVTVRGEAGL